MTKETIKSVQDKINVMQAFIEGKEIEFRHISLYDWTDSKNPLWQWGIYEYRVKQKNYRPFETIDEVFEAMKLHGGILCYDKSTSNPHCLSINTKQVFVNGYAVPFVDLFEKYLFKDNTPFGVEITK